MYILSGSWVAALASFFTLAENFTLFETKSSFYLPRSPTLSIRRSKAALEVQERRDEVEYFPILQRSLPT